MEKCALKRSEKVTKWWYIVWKYVRKVIMKLEILTNILVK